jgi:DNA-binding MarR family transcriptional regulator
MTDEPTTTAPVQVGVCPAHDVEPLIARELIMVAAHLRAELDQRLQAAGATLTSYLVMCAVVKAGSPTQRDIAAQIEVSEATLTRQVDVLERQGLVVRARPASNRRVVTVALTAQGLRRQTALADIARAFDHELTTRLGQARRGELFTTLSVLRQEA